MTTALGSESNVDEVLELLDVVEATRFDDLPSSWRDRVKFNHRRPIDYHSGAVTRRPTSGQTFVITIPGAASRSVRRLLTIVLRQYEWFPTTYPRGGIMLRWRMIVRLVTRRKITSRT